MNTLWKLLPAGLNTSNDGRLQAVKMLGASISDRVTNCLCNNRSTEYGVLGGVMRIAKMSATPVADTNCKSSVVCCWHTANVFQHQEQCSVVAVVVMSCAARTMRTSCSRSTHSHTAPV